MAGVVGSLAVAACILFAPRGADPASAAPRELPRSELELRDGVLYAQGESLPFDGVLLEHFPGGTRRVAIEIRHGVAHGLSRGWHENGQREVEEHFVDGISHGSRTRWYPNGEKKSACEIVDGRIEGTFTRWHDNGQVAAVVTMANGVAQGVSEAWYPSGARKSRVVLEAGEVVSREFFDDGEAL